jgi:peptidoglycan-associated lipoprotein
MFIKTCKILLISAAVLTLAACATTGGKNGASAAEGVDGGAGANGAASAGAGQMSSFDSSGQTDGKALQVGNQHYYFDFDKSDLRADDNASVKVQADYLIAHPQAKVRLEGNTDMRGSREYNIALGNRRALAVASVLSMDGVSKNQVTTVSYGAEKPVATGNDESAWAKNRRVDLVYLTPIK